MSGQPTVAEQFVEDIAQWRRAAGERAPSYHRLFHELVGLLQEGSPEGIDLADRFHAAWASRTFRIFYDRPLLLLASLRMDALVEGERHPLWSALGGAEPDPNGVTRDALLASLERESIWHSIRTKFVQTNETSRAVAWLWPAEIAGCSDGARPLALFEVGAAAGLNLVADHLPSPWTISSGARVRTVRAPRAVARVGIDAHPLDARSDGDSNWLRACVWAGERERLERLEAAIAAFRSSPAELERGDVTDVPQKLQALSAQQEERTLVLAFQTIMRDYVEEGARIEYERGMRRWLENSPRSRAAWVELEIDHGDPERRVPIVVHVHDAAGPVDVVLGRTGYHPAIVDVDDRAVERLAALLRA
jgi:hypothetical protein